MPNSDAARRRLLQVGLPMFLFLTASTLLGILATAAIFFPGALLGIPHNNLSVLRSLEKQLADTDCSAEQIAKVARDFKLRPRQKDWLVTRDGKVYPVGGSDFPLTVNVPKPVWEGAFLNLTFDQPPPVYQFAPIMVDRVVVAVNVLDTTSGATDWSAGLAYIPLLLWVIPTSLFSLIFTLLVLGRFDAALLGFREKLRRYGTGRSVAAVPLSELDDLDRSFDLMKARVETAAEELEEARSKAEEAERTRAEMLVDVAHSVGTPLGIVQGWLGFLSDGLVTEPNERGDLKEKIANELHRVQQMMERLEQLSQWEEAVPPLDLTRFPLKVVVDDLLALFRDKAEQRGVAIAVDLPEGLEVEADRTWIREIFQILIENVFRHAATARQVKISAVTRDSRVWIEVSDDGRGIEPGVVERLCGRFASAAGGFGLGLAIARKLVAAHGGELTIENSPSGGAVFPFSIPRGRRNHDGGNADLN